MLRQHHIIYVPGILDNIYHIQSISVRTWRPYGVRGHCHVMPWLGKEDYEAKFQRLLDEINKYKEQGHKVSLVGASAGASAVLNAYVAQPDKINGVVLICPKINGPETVSKKTYRKNPAFKESLELLQTNLPSLTTHDKATKILSYYSPADGSIPYPGSVIPGVLERRLPAIRHGYAIVYALTFGAYSFIRFLKRLDSLTLL
jgi:pimeloyl-ACP methyl ester carboxylesterase